MPKLPTDRMERFANLLAKRTPITRAYADAGYKNDFNGRNSYRLSIDPRVVKRVDEIVTGNARREIQANDRAVKRLAVSKELMARALLPSVTGNVADFLDIDEEGMPHPNFKKATYEQMAAIKSITIEEFIDKGSRLYDEKTDTYRPREVRRVRFTMRDQVPAVAMVARMLGFIAAIPRSSPPSRFEEQLRNMTPEQRDEHAQQLYKEVVERLHQDDAKLEAERLGIKLISPDIEDELDGPDAGGIGDPTK